jgi:hypothetical protein
MSAQASNNQDYVKPLDNSPEPLTEFIREVWFEIWYKPVLSVISRCFFE